MMCKGMLYDYAAALQEDNFNLENKIGLDLRAMEEEAAHLSGLIDTTRASKRDILAEIVEVERQIMLWERKIILEKEVRRPTTQEVCVCGEV